MRRALLLLSLVVSAVTGLVIPSSSQTAVTVSAEASSTTAPETTEPPSTTMAPTTTEAPTTTTIAEVVTAAEAPAPEPEQAPEPEPTTTTRRAAGAPAYASLEPCGGDLPPCEVKRRESGGNYRAINWKGCSGHGCFGAWQFDPNTWAWLGYEGRPDLADPEVQDEAARRLWDNGRGCKHWSGSTWNGCQLIER